MNEKKFTNLSKWIPLLILGAGVIASWTTLNNNASVQEGKIKSLEARASMVESSNNQVLVQLSQIQADLSWIRNALGKK
jgi:hypothetical protein